ncbi:PD-(D/E)XK nuclease-like domain-containing protein [Nocardia sp. NPDC058519]|uniref:PD-(D/E)XK nuclease-like domain-containing protein n=1 Tax=Nocardia sp. NPDC058519 TaxID=3346535 RepID=UPI00365BD582
MANDICKYTDLDAEVCDCKTHQAERLRMTAPTTPGLYPDIPELVYHSDTDSLSSTGVRTLVGVGGPAKFIGAEREHNDDFDIGTAAHTLLLGTGAGIHEVNQTSWQSKIAKEERAKARALGKIPLLTKQADRVRAMVEVALAHPEVAARLAVAVSEMTAYAMDPATWVMLRARFDSIRVDEDAMEVEIDDYKTTKDASPRGFPKSAAEYGYHVQEAHYRRVITELGYTVKRFTFIAQEKTPPYLVCLHEFGPDDIAEGDRIVTEGIELWDQCRAAGEWPGYGDQTNRMHLPSWALRKW